ncbi:hypothetical protein F0U61_16220 [Archangium violaceum]|nr:hypothetical protein F0U61_16220 [Archangium violaceum]
MQRLADQLALPSVQRAPPASRGGLCPRSPRCHFHHPRGNLNDAPHPCHCPVRSLRPGSASL